MQRLRRVVVEDKTMRADLEEFFLQAVEDHKKEEERLKRRGDYNNSNGNGGASSKQRLKRLQQQQQQQQQPANGGDGDEGVGSGVGNADGGDRMVDALGNPMVDDAMDGGDALMGGDMMDAPSLDQDLAILFDSLFPAGP